MTAPLGLVVMGVSGVGKTTLGRALGARLGLPFEDADDYHPLANIAKMTRGEPLSDADRVPWLQSLHGMLVRRRSGPGVVLACSALKQSYREQLEGAALPLHFVLLAGSAELIAGRLRQRRGHFMGEKLLKSQLAALEPPEAAMFVDAALSTAEQVALVLDELGRVS